MQIGSLTEKYTEMLLVLIPKVRQPEFLSQLRSISLCNVSYKVITKTLANKMKSVMGQRHYLPGGPNECSFIPGRQSTDNVIIYQEVLHSMRQRKQKKGFMLIKVDLEKPYDRLSWGFIRDTLGKSGLPHPWIRNIMQCVESTKMSVVWNGKNSAWFKPLRGIWHAWGRHISVPFRALHEATRPHHPTCS